MKIGNKIKSLRVEQNYSPIQVAEMLDVSENTYRRYENDKSSPDLNMLERIAKIYNKEIVDLLPECTYINQTNAKIDGTGVNNGTV